MFDRHVVVCAHLSAYEGEPSTKYTCAVLYCIVDYVDKPIEIGWSTGQLSTFHNMTNII